jgi:hypothetical protein
MELLMILLSFSSGGEALFVGIVIGLIGWALSSAYSKVEDKKREKKDNEDLEFLQANVADKGGLPAVVPQIFNYFKSKFGFDSIQDGRSIVCMINDDFEVTFMLYGNHYETMAISVRSKIKDKKKKWEFGLYDSQDLIISTIDKEIADLKWI